MEHQIALFALVAVPIAVAVLLVVLQLRANDRAAERRHAEWMRGLERLGAGAGAEVMVVDRQGRSTPPEGVSGAQEGRKTLEEIAAELRRDGLRPSREIAEAQGYRCQAADLGMATGFHIPGAIIYQPGEREERSILEGLAEAELQAAAHEPTAANVERLVALLTRPAVVRSASL